MAADGGGRVAAVIDILLVHGGLPTLWGKQAHLLHWKHRGSAIISEQIRQRNKQRRDMPVVGSVAVDMVVMGTQRRSQLQGT